MNAVYERCVLQDFSDYLNLPSLRRYGIASELVLLNYKALSLYHLF